MKLLNAKRIGEMTPAELMRAVARLQEHAAMLERAESYGGHPDFFEEFEEQEREAKRIKRQVYETTRGVNST